MQHEFWIERWESNQIGFHQSEFSPYLLKHWQNVSKKDDNVFVPMAGKSSDMLWLANSEHKVLGIELCQIAVNAFFTENNLTPIRTELTHHVQYKDNNIELLCGDFFALNSDDTKNINAVYDRASLIAMPPELRLRYAEKMGELLKPSVSILLVSMEYPEGEMEGPPFSVTEQNISDLYANNFTIKLIESNEVLESAPHLIERGLTSMVEKVYHLVRK